MLTIQHCFIVRNTEKCSDVRKEMKEKIKPIDTVEDECLLETIHIAPDDYRYVLPLRATSVTKIPNRYQDERVK